MSVVSSVLILLSVTLTATSQLLLKAGVSSAPMHKAMAASLPATFASLATSPMVIGGFICFGLSAVVWLFVLSRIDVSLAYPFIALGIVITMVGGHFILGEPLSTQRLIGSAIVLAGLATITGS